jgi:hypothetical protein
MNKPNGPPTLEQKIVAVLDGSDVSSATVMEVLELVEAAVAELTGTVESDRSQLLDLVRCPNPAETKSRIHAAETSVARLSAQIPKLRTKISVCLESERHSRWLADYRRLKAEQSVLARDFSETYKRVVTELVYVLNRMAALDIKCAEVDSQASNLQNEHRRLGKTELLARGIPAFSRSQPELAKTLVLPDFVESARTKWPCTSPTSFAAAYAETTSVPYHPGADWASPAETQRRREAIEKEQARSAAYHAQAAKDEEDRRNKEERERFANRAP